MSTYRTVARVLDLRTRAALPGLRVEAWDKNTGALFAATETDGDGLFSFLFEATGPDRTSTDGIDKSTTDGSNTGATTTDGGDKPTTATSGTPVGDVPDRTTTDSLDRTTTTDTSGKTSTDSSETPPFVPDNTEAAASFSMATFADPGGIMAEPPPPVVSFKIFDRDRLLIETADAAYQPKPVGGVFVDDRDLAVTLEVAFSAEPPPPPPPPPPPNTTPNPTPSTNPAPALGAAEVAIHELGESLAASVAGVQGELARYNTALGTYVLDEIDLSIPVLLRVSGLGQIMATVTEAQKPDAAVGQIRLRLRPVPPAPDAAVPPPAPFASKQPLDALLVLPREAIARLHGERIFGVGDLLRVASTAIGRASLARELFGANLSNVIDRAVLLSLPLPAAIGPALLKLGVAEPAQLLDADPAQLADTLTRDAALAVTPADIRQWQQASLAYLATLTFYGQAA